MQPEGTLRLATREKPNGETLTVPDPPPGQRNSAEFFLDHLQRGELIQGGCNSELGLKVQPVLEAALLSAQHGKSVSLS